MDFNRDFGRSLSYMVPVHFRGWSSTLGDLTSNRWEIHQEYAHHRDECRVVLAHQDLQMVAYIPSVNMLRVQAPPILHVSHMVNPKEIHIHGELPRFTEMEIGWRQEGMNLYADATFSMMNRATPSFRLSDILVPVKKLILPEEDERTVDDLLGHILSKQKNLMDTIAERKTRETLIEKPSAQIVKLFAA